VNAIGGIFHGKLHDKVGTKRYVICFIIELLIAIGLLISYNEIDEFNLFHASAFTFMWGMQDSAVEIFTSIICGFQFDSQTLPFSVKNFAMPIT